jgi:hypothetical protein
LSSTVTFGALWRADNASNVTVDEKTPAGRALWISGVARRAPRRTLRIVTGQPSEAPPGSRALALDELGRRFHAKPVADVHELAADIWESDEELDAFLADLRASRNASLN